ncbi:hypothetical protein INT45_007548 [Circinella minor]|uniref:Profilin n=1 Tax=Circinella minor TaxID=1195481 RepID=A0A8H7VKD0_9FUNG|nr:hypothetical protein INT45_007548 [Circinella minor]
MKTKQDTNGETVIDWQSYVDDDLMSSGYVSGAAIYDSNGSILANSLDLMISEYEFEEIADGFNGVYPFTEKQDGITIAEMSYYTVYSDDSESFFGTNGCEGVYIYKTGAVYLIVTYNNGADSVECKSVVESLFDRLKNEGW